MSIAVKICGLTSPDAVEAAARAGATHLGFIFFDGSPRNIAPARAYELATLAPGLRPVAVTVDADDRTLDAIVAIAHPRVLQLHGRETPLRVREVKARYRLPVIKAIAVETAADVDSARAYESVADMLLFDTKSPAMHGGSGRAFDWRLLAGKEWRAPWLLSGGLTPDNVADAIRTTHASGVDVSSGVERSRGDKDPVLIERFVREAHAAFAENVK